jgi:hypothetical protein
MWNNIQKIIISLLFGVSFSSLTIAENQVSSHRQRTSPEGVRKCSLVSKSSFPRPQLEGGYYGWGAS